MQLNYSRISAVTIAVGADTVLFGFSIPSDSVLTSVKGEVHMIGEEINWKKAAIYGVDGYIIGVEDPDTVKTYTLMWDTFVPKATGWASGGLNLDTGAQDTLSFFEPGQATVEDIMDLGQLPERIYKHRGMRTVLNNPIGYNFVASDASTYFPGAVIPLNVNKKYRVGQMESAVIFAGASPLLTDVTVTEKSTVTEETWGYLKYAADFLHMAYLALIGDVEAGAESPYENVMDDLEEELLPAITEVEAGDFDDMAYKVFSRMTAQVTVKGRFNVSALSLAS